MTRFSKFLISAHLLIFLTLPAFLFANTLSIEKEIQYQNELLNEVNRHRVSKGLNKLKLSEVISKEARVHSQDMAEKKMKFGHQDFDERINHIKQHIPSFRSGAENIACFKLPPAAVVQKWLTSKGHKRNIEGKYDLTGIGVVKDDKGWVYYTQIFIKQ